MANCGRFAGTGSMWPGEGGRRGLLQDHDPGGLWTGYLEVFNDLDHAVIQRLFGVEDDLAVIEAGDIAVG